MPPRSPGVRRHGKRWEVCVRVDGTLHRTSYPLDTPMSVMQQWRLSQRHAAPVKGSLGEDVTAYLSTVTHMPSYSDRARDLAYWTTALGPDRSRARITTQEIDAHLSAWLTAGLSPTTVLHRRTALLHLYHRLDGKDVPNPVRRALRPREPAPQPRQIPPDAIRQLLKTMRGKNRARLYVMATTGLPHKQIGQLTPEMWDGDTLHVPARAKGRGAPGRILPLSPHGVQALTAFATANAWGPFDRFNFRKDFRAACETLGYPRTWRPYDVRHSVATWLYQATGDLATVGRLLGHRSPKTTARYAASANAEIDAAAVQKAGRKLGRVGKTVGK